MVKIEAVIHPFKLHEVKAALDRLGCRNVVISDALVHNATNVLKTRYRGCEFASDHSKVKVEVLASANWADEIVEAISAAAHTSGDANEGTVLVYELSNAIRIHGGRQVELSVA